MKSTPAINKGSKQFCLAPLKVVSNRGNFLPFSDGARSNQTRLMATP